MGERRGISEAEAKRKIAQAEKPFTTSHQTVDSSGKMIVREEAGHGANAQVIKEGEVHSTAVTLFQGRRVKEFYDKKGNILRREPA